MLIRGQHQKMEVTSEDEWEVMLSSAEVAQEPVDTGLPHPEQTPLLVKTVVMESEAYLTCMNQALSTEAEEVMGLLVGWRDEETRIVYIPAVILLKRTDKRKDRVEIPATDLAKALDTVAGLESRRKRNAEAGTGREEARAHFKGPLGQAFRRAVDTARPLMVLGWYHSHPHITVVPSQVDIRTQFQYQQNVLPSWIGIIFGVFNDNTQKGSPEYGTGSLPYIAFQVEETPVRLELRGGEETVCGGELDFRSIEMAILPRPPGIPRSLDGRGVGATGMMQVCLIVMEELDAAYGTVREALPQNANLARADIARLQNASIRTQSLCHILSRLVEPLVTALNSREIN